MGWLLVLFDLPVTTKKEIRAAAKFRNQLLDNGYLMLQYSVYAKCAISIDKKESFIRALEEINPGTGDIRCVFITDAQWKDIKTIQIKDKISARSVQHVSEPAEQLQFW